MFGFLFKRSTKSTPSTPENQKSKANEFATTSADEKAAAVAKAKDLAGDEAAAAEFVLQCRFADVRLLAANHVHAKPLLEKLAQAMRETDRRVARLAQQRLDAIRQEEATRREAAACIERLQPMENAPVILPNRLSEIERAWKALHDVPQELVDEFEKNYAALQQRLLEQTELQRTLINLRNAAQTLSNELESTAPSSSLDGLKAQLDMLTVEVARTSASSEAPSLPKSLLSDIEMTLGQARRRLDQLAQRQAAITAHEALYSSWEAAADLSSDIDTLRRELRALPALSAEDACLFDQRLERLSGRFVKPERPPSVDPVKVEMAKYRQTLEAMERALEEGALQLAVDHENELRAADSLTLKWKDDEPARLARARAELSRLKDWARWGGQVSREELIKTAEELPSKEGSPSEIAKKIGTLRSQWKSMDATSGAAARETWLRFDSACTAAYAPVAAHFNALAAERKENLEKAQALIFHINDFAVSQRAEMESGAPDWKKIFAFRSRIVQAWHGIGTVDRKEKKSLDKQFSDAMDAVSRPLAAAQQEEIKRREELIDQVAQLDPADKNSMETVRSVQQQWQQQAKCLPLERKDEQALWRQFRAACDEHVTRRKTALQEVGALHQTNHQLKSALCEKLESAANGPSDNLENVLNEVEQEWNAIGSAVRSDEQSLRERYRHALSGVRSKLAEDRQAAQREKLGDLYKKLSLCLEAEEILGAGTQKDNKAQKDNTALADEWNRCNALPDGFERLLHTRFQAALSAIQTDDKQYAAMLKQNRGELERDLLRMEIKLNIESPPELSADRLKLQVEALQASLKSGSAAIDRNALLRKLCELPALHDQDSRLRIERVIDRLGACGE